MTTTPADWPSTVAAYTRFARRVADDFYALEETPMIRPGDLQDRNFDQNEPKGAAEVHADLTRAKGHVHASAEAHLAALKQRIAKAKALVAPDGIDPDVWELALDAAVKAIEAP